jgi:hypothetical protein
MVFIVKRDAVVIPAGISASTQTVIVTNNVDFNGTYSMLSPPSPYWRTANELLVLTFTGASWTFLDTDTGTGLQNPSSDGNYIPTTGWTNDFGIPVTITITAA